MIHICFDVWNTPVYIYVLIQIYLNTPVYIYVWSILKKCLILFKHMINIFSNTSFETFFKYVFNIFWCYKTFLSYTNNFIHCIGISKMSWPVFFNAWTFLKCNVSFLVTQIWFTMFKHFFKCHTPFFVTHKHLLNITNTEYNFFLT